MAQIRIILKTGEQLVASCRDKEQTKRNILRGHPQSHKSGIMWWAADGYRDISAEDIKAIH